MNVLASLAGDTRRLNGLQETDWSYDGSLVLKLSWVVEWDIVAAVSEETEKIISSKNN